jgi:hypothetical protein
MTVPLSARESAHLSRLGVSPSRLSRRSKAMAKRDQVLCAQLEM